MNFFDMESPFHRFLNRMTDLLILNLITLLMCLPVITAGASLTAMHYVLLKLVRGEEGYILSDFRRSFVRNFCQATAIWCIMLVYGLLTTGSLFLLIMRKTGQAPAFMIAISAAAVFLLYLLSLYIFPLLSRYDNTIRETFLNALMLVFGKFPHTIGMAVITALPAVAMFYAAPLLALVFLFGLSLPGYACAMLYSPLFEQIEENGRGEE